MAKVVIEAARRTVTGKHVGALRRAGKLPGVMYGHKFEPTAIEMDFREASRVLHAASQSQIITINLDGKEYAALVRERQKNYIRNEFLHIDFQVVSLTEKIRTKVTINLTGTSPAVKEYNAVVYQELNEVEVEGMPGDLPESIIVDVSSLETIGQALTVGDLNVGDKIEIFRDPSETVVVITSGAAEEEEEVEEVVEELEEPEVIERGKKEEEGEEEEE